MTTQHDERKRKADQSAQSAHFFSYVLRFQDDGSFYVGSTNAPYARWTEHAIGIGAKATAGRGFTVCMALPFLTRKEAEYNEKRLQEALDRGPRHIEAMLAVFDQILNVVRPPKTFSQLYEEEQRYMREMERVFHHSTALSWNPGGLPPTACGYDGPNYYSTQDWEALKKMARDEDFTGNIYGREVCRRCLELEPTPMEATS